MNPSKVQFDSFWLRLHFSPGQVLVYVESLEEVRSYLKEHELLGAGQPAAIKISGSQLRGLNITLIEKSGGG